MQVFREYQEKKKEDTDGLRNATRSTGVQPASGQSRTRWDRLGQYAQTLAGAGDTSLAKALGIIEGRNALAHTFPTLAQQYNDASEFEAITHGVGGGNLDAFSRRFGHQNPRVGGKHGGGMGGGFGTSMSEFKQEMAARKAREQELKDYRDRLGIEAYFKQKELNDRMSVLNNFFGGNGRNYNKRETSTTQQMVNNAGSWEARPITTTHNTDMTYDILQSLLRA